MQFHNTSAKVFFAQEAEKSIRFYKNMRETERDRKLLDIEISKLKETLNDIRTESSDKHSFNWTDVTTGTGRKAIIIGIVLVMLCVSNGVFAMSIYAANIFQETGSNLSPNMSAIVLGIIQLIASCITTHLVDRSGRKVIFFQKVKKNQIMSFTIAIEMA